MAKSDKIEKKATQLPHIFLIDWHDTGLLTEVALVKEEEDGTLHGILVDTLHPIDKGRLKKVVTSIHADKYPMWELMSQATLSNGLNFLDYAHYNLVKVKRPKGARTSTTSLANFTVTQTDKLVGSDTSNPAEFAVGGGRGGIA